MRSGRGFSRNCRILYEWINKGDLCMLEVCRCRFTRRWFGWKIGLGRSGSLDQRSCRSTSGTQDSKVDILGVLWICFGQCSEYRNIISNLPPKSSSHNTFLCSWSNLCRSIFLSFEMIVVDVLANSTSVKFWKLQFRRLVGRPTRSLPSEKLSLNHLNPVVPNDVPKS